MFVFKVLKWKALITVNDQFQDVYHISNDSKLFMQAADKAEALTNE